MKANAKDNGGCAGEQRLVMGRDNLESHPVLGSNLIPELAYLVREQTRHRHRGEWNGTDIATPEMIQSGPSSSRNTSYESYLYHIVIDSERARL